VGLVADCDYAIMREAQPTRGISALHVASSPVGDAIQDRHRFGGTRGGIPPFGLTMVGIVITA
jgi:hypothetical protein